MSPTTNGTDKTKSGQTPAPAPMSETMKTRFHAMKDLVASFDHAMLVTHTKDGTGINARPMAILKSTANNELTFLTDISTDKVDEIIRNPNATVTMQNGRRAVSMGGTVHISQDRAEIKELWKPQFNAWLEGPTDPNAALIKFTPERGEYWDTGAGTILGLLVDKAQSFFTEKKGPDWEAAVHGQVALDKADA